eukprot:848551-Pelagomonas_calceolata.AAC.3
MAVDGGGGWDGAVCNLKRGPLWGSIGEQRNVKREAQVGLVRHCLLFALPRLVYGEYFLDPRPSPPKPQKGSQALQGVGL